MKNTNLLFHFQNTDKSGTQPWFASYGFAAANELPGPVDHRTTDVGAALEWSNARGVVKVGWDGSWFHNNVSTLVWDNPLRADRFHLQQRVLARRRDVAGPRGPVARHIDEHDLGDGDLQAGRRTRARTANLGFSK